MDKITFSIDEDLKTELKMISVKQHRTIKDILNEIIEDFVNENK